MTADGESGGWYERLDRELVHDGFSRVFRDTVRMPDGTTPHREVVEHNDAVAIVPLLADGTVVLLRQYRHPVGAYVLEIPAGMLDVDGESPQQAAHRELREEIGYEAGSLRPLTVFANSSGWTTERTHVFLATGLAESGPPAGFTPRAEEADMEIVRLGLTGAVAAIRDGTITDAKTIIGLLLAHDVAGARACPDPGDADQ